MKNARPADKQKGKARTAKRYGIACAAGLAFGALLTALRGFSPNLSLQLNAQYACDGYFIASAILLGVGGLLWASTMGIFDMLSYGVKCFFAMFTTHGRPKEYHSYYDYKVAKDTERATLHPLLLCAGALCLAVSFLALAVYGV